MITKGRNIECVFINFTDLQCGVVDMINQGTIYVLEKSRFIDLLSSTIVIKVRMF